MTTRPVLQVWAAFGATNVDLAAAALVRSVSTRRGRQRILAHVTPGSGNVAIDNTYRNLDPRNDTGIYSSAGSSQVKSGKWFNLCAVWNGTQYPMFTGLTTRIQINDSDIDVSTAALSLIDPLSVLAGKVAASTAGPVGDGEDSGARISRLLTYVGYVGPPANSGSSGGFTSAFGAASAVDVGASQMLATTETSNILNEAQLTTDSERGDFFANRAGTIVFHNRQWRYTLTSAATFGDAAGEIPYSVSPYVSDDVLIVNDAIVGRVGGVPQSASDATSMLAHPGKGFTRTDLIVNGDGECLQYAQWLVTSYANADEHVDSIEVTLNDDDANWGAVLGLDIGSLVTINRRAPQIGLISFSAFIDGIDHDIAADGDGPWKVTLRLSDATPFLQPLYFQLDDATKGKLDVRKITF